MNFKEDNANQLYKNIIEYVNKNPDYEVSPRGFSIKEKLAVKVTLTNPRNCLVTIAERKLNHQFAIIEKFEYLYGKHDAERLIAYNSNLKNYAGNYSYFDGNYAQRINYWLDHVYHLLLHDRDSRQAVISIYDATARHQSADIPCTLTLQFFIRDNKLHLIGSMRSNDLLWGFPYDINAFCFLQEVLAKWLNVELGIYTHFVGSMHIYKEPEKNYKQLLSCVGSVEFDNHVNPVWDLNYEDTKKYLPMFITAEQMLRTDPLNTEWEIVSSFLPNVLSDYLKLLQPKWKKQV